MQNTESKSALRRAIDVLFGAVFLGILGTPGVLAALRGDVNAARTAEIQRRRPTPPPKLPWKGASPASNKGFSASLDDWFEDAWGGRETALRANARASMELFGTSPAGYLVFGRDGWVFSRQARSFESFTGTDPMGSERLRDWQNALEDRRRWLADRGIDHVVVLVPHKSSIYPEKLRASIAAARGTSRLEEFQAWMAEHSDVNVIDVAPALRAAKESDGPWQHVYSPHGVHWSVIGGHAAYEVVLRDLAARHDVGPPLGLDAFEVVDRDGQGDSWASRMLLDGVIEMENIALAPKAPTGVKDVSPPPGGTKRDYLATHPDASRPRILMIHDSFGPDIRKLFALHASRMESRWVPFVEAATIERAKPDIVIELITELALELRTPFRRAAFLSPETRARFERGRTLGTLDVTEPLTFDVHPERVTSESGPDGARITVLGGGGFLALGEIPAAAGQGAAGDESVYVGLTVHAERAGRIALHVAPRLDRAPAMTDLIAIEVGTEPKTIALPLPRTAPGTKAWLVLSKATGTVTLTSLAFRAVSEK